MNGPSPLAAATSTEVVIRAPHGSALSPDEIRDAFTRHEDYDIIDYAIETKGLFWLRVKSVRLVVAARVDNVNGTIEP